jgi:hypothetical protein
MLTAVDIAATARAAEDVRAKYLALGGALALSDRNKRHRALTMGAQALLVAMQRFAEQDMTISATPADEIDDSVAALDDETMREHLAEAREVTALFDEPGLIDAMRVREPSLVDPIRALLPKVKAKAAAHRAVLAFILGEPDWRELGFDAGIPIHKVGTKVSSKMTDLEDILA